METASFSTLSPNTSMLRVGLTSSAWKMASVATGSTAEIREPNVKLEGEGKGEGGGERERGREKREGKGRGGKGEGRGRESLKIVSTAETTPISPCYQGNGSAELFFNKALREVLITICSQGQYTTQSSLVPRPLPPCMHSRGSPLDKIELGIHDTNLLNEGRRRM